MDFTCYILSTYDYYCANYAVIVLPSQTSGDKIVYVRSYQAEIGGETYRLCGQCVCINRNPRVYYNFGCIALQTCTCALYCKTPYSLKRLASKIVWVLQTKSFFVQRNYMYTAWNSRNCRRCAITFCFLKNINSLRNSFYLRNAIDSNGTATHIYFSRILLASTRLYLH